MPFDPNPSARGESDDLSLEAPPKRGIGCLGSFAIAAGVLLVVGGIAGYVGFDYFKKKLTPEASSTKDPATIGAWMTEDGLAGIVPPPGYAWAGAFRFSLLGRGLKTYALTPAGAAIDPVAHTPMDVAIPDRTSFAVIKLLAVGSELERAFVQVTAQASRVGSKPEPETLSVAGRTVPAFKGEAVHGDRRFATHLARTSPDVVVLGIGPTDGFEDAPYRALLASALHANPATISFGDTPKDNPAETIRKAFATGTADDRRAAIAAVGSMPVIPPDVVTALAEATKTGRPDAKRDAVQALGQIGKKTFGVPPYLRAALADKDVKMDAIIALGGLGSSAEPAMADLKRIAADKKESKAIRHAALDAIHRIHPAKAAGASKKKPAAHHRKKK